jgi:hypothetical protein
VVAPAKERSIGEFDLLTLLGEGAFAKVFKVRDKLSGEIFANK